MSQATSKNPKVFEKQIKRKELYINANLVAQTSDSQSLLTISGALATRSLAIDLGELVSQVHTMRIINRATGANVAINGTAPVIAAGSDPAIQSKVSVILDATGSTDVCIELIYR
jgi:hypothetical protein